jgi:hypothetical protein
MLKRPTRWIATLLICAILGAFPAGAHDLPLDRIMNGFVKIEPHEAHLVVRVPLDLLRAVPLPLDGDRYDIAAANPAVEKVLSALGNDFTLRENGVRLVPSSAVGRLSPLADRSLQTYATAVAHTAEAPDPDMAISFELGYLDAHFTYPISSPAAVFTIGTSVAADLQGTAKLTVRYLPLDDAGRAIIISSEDGDVALDPAWYQASAGFIRLGIEHILSGIDHLLFLLCLVIPFRRIVPLVPVITAFTLGHSVTLIGTAYNLAPAGAWFAPLIETGIAASIVYMALENIVGADLRHRWIIAGLFGLVHGFGFSSALKDQLQFAGSHLLVSLFSFNLGIEIGQLAVLCLFIPALALLFRGAMSGRMGIIVLSALVAHTAWHWMIERGEVFWQAPRPRVTGAAFLVMGGWAAALLIAVGAAVLVSRWLERKWPRLVQAAAEPSDRLRA